LRQINEWAFIRDQRLQLFVNTPPRGRDKTVSRSSDIDQIFTAIVANNDRIETACPWRKPTHYELLPSIDAKLGPGACALSRLVHAVLALRYDAFKPLLANG